MTDITTKLADKFLQLDFELCETKFTILPLNAFEAYKLLEYVREHIGVNLLQFNASDIASSLVSLVATKTMHVEHVRQTLFTKVRYKLPTSVEGAMMKNESDIVQAFHKGTAADIYELLLRCVFVNFFSTFKRLSAVMPTQ